MGAFRVPRLPIQAGHRCRHGRTSAAPPDPGRPKNVYLREDRILAALAKATIERPHRQPAQRMTEDDIKRIVDALADIREVVQNADSEDKAEIYSALGLRLTYHPAQQIVRAEVNLDPDDAGVVVRVRGGT